MIEKSTLITFSSRHRNNSEAEDYNFDSEMKDLWELKTQYQRKDEYTRKILRSLESGQSLENSLYFCWILYNQRDIRNFRSLLFERKKKNDFNNLLNTHFNQPQHVLCGHNAKEFDIPFIARRMIINQIVIPNEFILKPWEIHIWIPWNYGSW
jgi:DNA polymerase elongation subunit (family B)